VPLAKVDAEGGVDAPGSGVIKRFAMLGRLSGDEGAGGGEPKAADEWAVVRESAVDEGAEAVRGAASCGLLKRVQPGERTVLGLHAHAPEVLGGGAPLVAFGDVPNDSK